MEEEGLVKAPEEENETKALKEVNEGLQHVKQSGSNKNRAAFKAFKSLAFGKNVRDSRAKKSLSQLVNLNRRSIDQAIKRREKILCGEISSWIHTKRKVHNDVVHEDAKVVYDYWNATASRPTGDKKDTLKNRVGKKEYLHHACHMLEKTQTETYLEFCSLHPEIKIKQRKFENLKPFYIKQARE